MKSYYIKCRILWTDIKNLRRQTSTYSGIYQTPYIKPNTENDICLINKLLHSFICKNEDVKEKELVIAGIEILDTHEVNLYG